MKNLTNIMIAAAALVVTAGMAKAQVIKAEVPFSFRANGTTMPAGEVRVQHLGPHGSAIFSVANVDANRAILAVPYVRNSETKEGNASLTFQCGSDRCSLVQIDTGAGQTYRFPAPKPGRNEDTHLSVIRAALVK